MTVTVYFEHEDGTSHREVDKAFVTDGGALITLTTTDAGQTAKHRYAPHAWHSTEEAVDE